ncbi:MAG: hypothetical protein WA265_01245 [Rhodomicrobium sp.]
MRFPSLRRRRALFVLAGTMAAAAGVAAAVYGREGTGAPDLLVLQRAYDRGSS